VSGSGKTSLFLDSAWRLMKIFEACGSGKNCFRWGCSVSSGAGVQGASIVVDRRLLPTETRRDVRWVGGCGKTWFFLDSAWRLWKSVFTLAFRGNIIFSGVVRRHQVPVFEKHRLRSTESRWG
jgi:hypothetical protein